MTNHANLENLYKRVRMHKGAINAIAERAKCSRAWVWMVLKGSYVDYTVYEAAVFEVEDRERRAAMIRQKMETMTVNV